MTETDLHDLDLLEQLELYRCPSYHEWQYAVYKRRIDATVTQKRICIGVGDTITEAMDEAEQYLTDEEYDEESDDE